MHLMPAVDTDKCNGCGLCISICYCGALILVHNIVTIIETESCGWCTQCEAICPTDAISCAFEIVVEEK